MSNKTVLFLNKHKLYIPIALFIIAIILPPTYLGGGVYLEFHLRQCSCLYATWIISLTPVVAHILKLSTMWAAGGRKPNHVIYVIYFWMIEKYVLTAGSDLHEPAKVRNVCR